MIPDTIICTVGTSLAANLRREGGELADLLDQGRVLEVAKRIQSRPPDDRSMGAEINSLNRILEAGKAKSGRLLLLVSDTRDGGMTGELLQRCLVSSAWPHPFRDVRVIMVDGLRDDDVKRFRNQGLRNLVRIIVDEVRTVGPGRILINATGGYKAQISFAGMIGQAMGIPVCYLFERFSEVIELPPQPISLDLGFWLEHVDTFNSLDDGWELTAPFNLPDERFTGLVECEEVDGAYLAALSPVGQLFHDSLRLRFVQKSGSLLPPDSGMDPQEKEVIYEDKNPNKHRGLEAYVKRLFRVPYVKRAYSHYYNPDLPRSNRFRRSAKGEVEKVEAWYHHSGKLSKIDLYTTAQTPEQRDACIADLCERFRIGRPD